jgi:predicted Zn-dependent protease
VILSVPRRPGILALLLGSFLALCGCSRSPAPPAAEKSELLARAQALAASHQEIKAADLLSSALPSLAAEEHGAVLALMARLYFSRGAVNQALEAAERAAAAGIDTAEILYLLGDSQRRLLRVGEAEATLTRLLEKEPGHLQGKLSLARLRFRADDAAAALALFEEYLRQAPLDDPLLETARLEYGRALRAAGRHQEAADQFAFLLEGNPSDTMLYSELSSALYRLRLREQARFLETIYKGLSQRAFEEYVEEGLRARGAAAFALSQEAINREHQKRYLEAFRGHHKALAIDLEDPRIRIYHAELCLRFLSHREALEALNAGLEAGIRPESGLWWMKGRVELELRLPAEAARSFQRAIEALAAEGRQGGSERGQAVRYPALLGRCRALFESGALDGALAAALEAAMEAAREATQNAAGEPWEPLYWQGRIALERGDSRAALELLSRAAERGGQAFREVAFWQAAALGRLGRKREAAEALAELAQRMSGFLPLYDELLALESDPGRARDLRERRDKAAAMRRRLEEIEAELAKLPLAECGLLYLEAGKILLSFREPAAFDLFLLAADLLPQNGEVLKLLLSAITRQQDVFVRLRLQRRLLELEPGNTASLKEVARIYLRLHVRLDEAERLARSLHAAEPSAESYLLLAETTIARGGREEGRKLLEEGRARFPADKGLLEALARLQ